MPDILLNGEEKQIASDFTVAALVKELNLENKKLAVEVNMEIIPRSQFEQHTLESGDKIEVIHAVGGG
ncbi:MAG: sulfur carrier protein ThiS [Candidatus Marithrix sp.]